MNVSPASIGTYMDRVTGTADNTPADIAFTLDMERHGVTIKNLDATDTLLIGVNFSGVTTSDFDIEIGPGLEPANLPFGQAFTFTVISLSGGNCDYVARQYRRIGK